MRTSRISNIIVLYHPPLQWSVGGVLSKMTRGGGREGNNGPSSMTPAQTLSAIAASPLPSLVPSEVKPENEGSAHLQVQ